MKRRVRTRLPNLMLTPMIDMFTIILVYLIVNFSPEQSRIKKSAEIQIPKSGIQLSKVPHIQLEVTESYVQLNGKAIEGLVPQSATSQAWLALQDALVGLQRKDQPILLIADKNTSFRLVDRAVANVAQAGFSEVYFLTDQKPEQKVEKN